MTIETLFNIGDVVTDNKTGLSGTVILIFVNVPQSNVVERRVLPEPGIPLVTYKVYFNGRFQNKRESEITLVK